jgi:two-component system, LytTR family, response regulator
MNTIKAIAIDDEPIALDVIRAHVAKASYIDLKATFVSATEALVYMKKEPIDLVFLDINMPDLTGIDFSSMIDPSVLVVFTTAYSEYAIKGFELNALDYLLKPFPLSRFLQACQRASDRLSEKNDKEDLFVKDGNTLVRIDLEQLLYVEADSNYLTFHEKNKKTTVRHTLTDLSNKLPKTAFVKVNKSCIVALKKIDRIENQYIVVNGKQLILARSYRDTLLKSLLE